MNKGKKRCGGCQWFVGTLSRESDGICGILDGRVNVDSGRAVRCPHFKRKPYKRGEKILVKNIPFDSENQGAYSAQKRAFWKDPLKYLVL